MNVRPATELKVGRSDPQEGGATGPALDGAGPTRNVKPPEADPSPIARTPTPPQAPQAPRSVSRSHWSPDRTDGRSQAPQTPPRPSRPTQPQAPQAPRVWSRSHWTPDRKPPRPNPPPQAPRPPTSPPSSTQAPRIPCASRPSVGVDRPPAQAHRGTQIRQRLVRMRPVAEAQQLRERQHCPPHSEAELPFPARPAKLCAECSAPALAWGAVRAASSADCGGSARGAEAAPAGR